MCTLAVQFGDMKAMLVCGCLVATLNRIAQDTTDNSYDNCECDDGPDTGDSGMGMVVSVAVRRMCCESGAWDEGMAMGCSGRRHRIWKMFKLKERALQEALMIA